MKITVLDGHTLNPGDLDWASLEAFGGLTVHARTGGEPNIISKRIGDADIVLTNKTPLTKEVLSACPSIRLVCVLATGYDVVDVAAAKDMGISVCNVPAYGTQAVAQFTMALLLEVCHRAGHHSQAVHEGRWQSSADFCFWDYPLIELEGKVFGLMGYGRIGQAVAKLAAAFGMRVLAFDPTQKQDVQDTVQMVDLDTLFQKSDIISLHCPLTAENRYVICQQTLDKMKDGMIILNTARGPLVDEVALEKALASGKVAAAGLDVVSREPICPENPLLQAPNCILTPHIAWATREARQRLLNTTVENVRRFLAGNPVNVVNS